MFKKIILLFLLLSISTQAQHTIKGKMEPVKNYTWVILYQLHGAKQNYITNTSVIEGEFTIGIPENTTPGIYRLVYDMKNRLFVDLIFNNENISFTFNPQNPNKNISFAASEENKIYQNYLKAITKPQQQIDSLQVVFFNTDNKNNDANIIKSYQKNYVSLKNIQTQFEEQFKGKLVNHFIKASARFNAVNPIKTPEEYLDNIKRHFFDNIDFNNQALLQSTFINDKINDFIFYLNTSDNEKKRTQLFKEAITTVIDKIGGNLSLTKDTEEGLLYTFAQQQNVVMTNYMLNYYLQLPKELQDVAFINDIKGQLKTAVGMRVPNISWQENGSQKDLYSLTDKKHYVIAFWSSTCGHCLKELPLLSNYMKGHSDTEIIAVGLETEESKTGWQTEIAKYPNWKHVYGENKWKNKFARDYGVNATPSFFILDADKIVLSKPDDVEGLKMFFEKN